LRSWRYLLRAEDPACRHEPLATLGDSLGLFRHSTSATRFVGGTVDVGAYERELLCLTEVDAQGRSRRTEAFATDHLGDAVVRLYDRYAELRPEGPAHPRAAATARSVALHRPVDLARYAASLSPAVELVDHRTLGTWSARGAEELLRHWSSAFDLGRD